MSATELAAVLRMIPNLTSVEKAQALARLKATSLGVDGGRALAEVPDAADWLLEGMYFELRRRGLLGAQERVPARQVQRLAPDWNSAAGAVRKLLAERLRYFGAAHSPRYAIMLSLGNVAARALADYLEAGQVPIGLKVLLTNVGKVPQAIDRSFPSYLESGMLHCLVVREWSDGGKG